MKKHNSGFCGLNCETCPILIATKNDDDQLRIKALKEYSNLYGELLGEHRVKQEDMNCGGCQSESVFIGCLTCPVRKCCREKEFATCANCSNYDTCKVLNHFYAMPEYQQAKDNLDRIRTGR
ncbi:MAG: DUF3795 domain-containing protein [Candidatus Omnitrophica bacterium]|nr:DUF3795 domain-containing protein [Candidatus Omnitrophota bacterium]